MLVSFLLNTRKRPRPPGLFVLQMVVLFALVGGVSGCHSKSSIDTRPGWVQEAEARLQRPPSWQVSGSGVESERESENRSGFYGSGQPATSIGIARESGNRRNDAASSARSMTVNEPPGVQWGETKITVSVED
jgi:hypothetical protein